MHFAGGIQSAGSPQTTLKIQSLTNMEPNKHFLFVKGGAFVEKPYDPQTSLQQITGYLVDVNFKEGDTGSFFTLQIVNQNKFYMLSMFAGSRVGRAFLMLAPSLSAPYLMTISIEAKGGKEFLTISQLGQRIEWYRDFTGYGKYLPKANTEKLSVLLSYAKANVLPLIHQQPNPYPRHVIYRQPMRRRFFSNEIINSEITLG